MHSFAQFLAGIGALTCFIGIAVYAIKRFRRRDAILLFGRRFRLPGKPLVMVITGSALLLISLLLGVAFSEEAKNEKRGAKFGPIDGGQDIDASVLSADLLKSPSEARPASNDLLTSSKVFDRN